MADELLCDEPTSKHWLEEIPGTLWEEGDCPEDGDCENCVHTEVGS